MARYLAGEHHGRVYCNGTELDDVMEVDTDLGFAVVCDKDKDGNKFAHGDEIATKLVIGKMQFVMGAV